ncbi:MAG: hypothetical protein JSS66_04845 [Armatimonadetes bacterium]|nr:hypothetical protein [Armatimonadota bacterium]
MAIEVQILLPDNLGSSYLRADFVERGEIYSVDKTNPNSAYYTSDTSYNQHSLIIGFKLVDTETREEVPLSRLSLLKLSNDPEFSSSSTIQLVDWPEAPATFDSTKNYRRKLDPLYFTGESGNQYRSGWSGDGEEAGDGDFAGFFIIEGWPLSATGGLSTVYLQAEVLASGSSQVVTYPNGYGLYDQIFWQSERPGTPGLPTVLKADSGYTGRKTSWEFRASEEQASALFNTGVSRYVGDIIELRPEVDGVRDAFYSTRSGALNTHAKRAILPEYDAQHTFQLGFRYNNGDYGASLGLLPAHVYISLASGQHIVALTTDKAQMSMTRPDIAVNASIKLVADNSPEIATSFYVGIYNGVFLNPSGSTAYILQVSTPAKDPPTATFYRLNGETKTPNAVLTTTLPATATDQIRKGGRLELYATDRNDGTAIVRGYFVAEEREEAFLLVDAQVQSLGAYSSLGGLMGVGANAASQVWLRELAVASGRFVLGGDFGNCFVAEDTAVEFDHVSVNTTDRKWADRIDTDFSVFTYGPDTYGDGATAEDELLYLRAPSSETAPSFSEIQAHFPTAGLRTQTEFELAHYSGDFYVGISEAPVQDSVPTALRCESEATGTTMPATLVLCFSSRDKAIEVRQRRSDGTLSRRRVRRYATQDFEAAGSETFVTWKLSVSAAPTNGQSDGTWLVLHRNGEFWGTHHLDLPLEGSSGLGWYISAGVRGGLHSEFSDWTEIDDPSRGQAVLRAFSTKPLPGGETPDDAILPHFRRFFKGKFPTQNHKPFLGQMLVSSCTDESDQAFAVPEAPLNFDSVRLVAQESVSLASAPDTVDGVTVRAGDRILCANQANAAENGIYVVGSVGSGSDGVWVRAGDLATAEDVQFGNRVEVDECFAVRLATTSNVSSTTGTTSAVLDQAPSSVDDVVLSVGDRILVRAQTAAERNGIYEVSSVGSGSNGVWNRADDADTYDEFGDGALVVVSRGTTYAGRTFEVSSGGGSMGSTQLVCALLDAGSASTCGTAWYIDEWVGDFAMDSTPMNWSSAVFVQLLTMSNVRKLLTTARMSLRLQEIKMRPAADDFIAATLPRVRFYAEDSGDVGSPFGGWHKTAVDDNNTYASTGFPVSRNNLLQFDVTASEVEAVEGDLIWLATVVPSGFELVAANAKRMGETDLLASGALIGARRAYGMWHKTFAGKITRTNNSLHGAYLQCRVQADSHARLAGSATLLSEEVKVDREAPGYYSDTVPRLTEVIEPAVRTAILSIQASDDDAGLLAFRVVMEGDHGVVRYSPWQRWGDFVSYKTLATVKAINTAEQALLNGDPGNIDGVSDWQTGDRLLLAGQSAQETNGIYVVNTVGAWVRATDLDEDGELMTNLRVMVENGDLYAGSTWYLHLGDPNANPPYYVMGSTDQVWLDIAPESTVINYTVYLQGKWPLDESGEVDSEMLAQNQALDGARRVWAQVMDRAGNISESMPLTITAQGVAIVDTTPPTGELSVVDPTSGSAQETTKDNTAVVQLSLEDRITAVKDMRTRMSQAGAHSEWSNWKPYLEYLQQDLDANVPSDDLSTDGLKHVEAQFRDYGNNANQAGPLWEVLTRSGQTERIFTCSAPWVPPGEDKEWLYLGGIETITYSEYTLELSNDPAYSSGDAFLVTSPDENDLNRVVYVRSSDDVSVTVDGEEWNLFVPYGGDDLCYGAPAHSFRIDAERGLIVFCDTLTESPTFIVTVVRRSGVLYRWDGSRLELAYDFGYYQEKGILCMLPLDDYICLGGFSGNVWGFDGVVAGAALFTATDDTGALPVTFLTKFQFAHENFPYVYLGTAVRPRLFRFPVSPLASTGGLTQLGGGGFLDEDEGTLTCAIGEYNRVFIGTDSNRIVQYVREPGTNDSDVEADLVETTLRSQYLGTNEPYSMPVSALASTGDQVLAAIGNKPEIWAYSQKKVDSAVVEGWSTTLFDRFFVNNPTPWQFYASDTNQLGGGDTLSSEEHPALTWAAITDPNEEHGIRELVTINGAEGQAVVFRTDEGSDWEQAISNATAWTLEFSTMAIEGTGAQSIEVADGRYRLHVDLYSDRLVVSSGENVLSAPFAGWSDEVEVRSLSTNVVYPERGNKKVWNFSNASSGNDFGPYWIGGEDDTGSTQGWLAGDFVIPGENGAAGSIIVEDETDTASFVLPSQSLRVQALKDGEPTVYWKSSQGVAVDNTVSFYVRLRLNLGTSFSAVGAKLEMAWSPMDNPDARDFVFNEGGPLQDSDGYVTYRFSPPWTGTMRSLAIRLDGVKTKEVFDAGILSVEGDYSFDVDFISVNTEQGSNNISDNFTPVRIGVNGRDLKIWVGRTETPLVNSSDFLGWPTQKSEIVFGKTNTSEAACTFGWSYAKFIAGSVVTPVSYEVKDFGLMWRFPSSGGVTHLVPYQGALWALCAGISDYMFADNPDDRTIHAFSYNRQQEFWKTEPPRLPRDGTTNGFVRAVTACQYRNSLVLCAERVGIMAAPS